MRATFRDLWDEHSERIVIGTIAILIVVGCGVLTKLHLDDEREWERFKMTHKCKIVSYQAASSSVGYGATGDGKGGTVVVTNPSRTGWLCDDGVTYYR